MKRLIDALHGAAFKLSGEEIAEVLWLAMQNAQPTPEGMGEDASPGDSCDAGMHTSTQQQDQQYMPQEAHPPVETPQTPLHTTVHRPYAEGRTRVPKGLGAVEFYGKAATALPGALDLARALRPLKRMTPSSFRLVLDEEATVQAIADSGLWMPLLRPMVERHYDIALVVEASASMVIWQQTVAEFQRLLECHGAFRNVTTWSIVSDQDEPSHLLLYPGIYLHTDQSSAHPIEELVDPLGKRLILLLSDTVSIAWYQGHMARALKLWAEHNVTTLVQMFPASLWRQTALGEYRKVSLQCAHPLTDNLQARVESTFISRMLAETPTGTPIPVITLDAHPLAQWANFVTGKQGANQPGLLLPEATLSSPETHYPMHFPTASERVDAFVATASPLAQQLAGYLATVPLTLPIMRLVQQHYKLSQTRHSHLAEVFLSGLLTRETPTDIHVDPDEVWYDFYPGVREILREIIRVSDGIEVMQDISDYLCQRSGCHFNLRALLADPTSVDNIAIEDSNHPFTTITLDTLNDFGGKYRDLSQRITKTISDKTISVPPIDVLLDEQLQLEMRKSFFVYFSPLIPSKSERLVINFLQAITSDTHVFNGYFWGQSDVNSGCWMVDFVKEVSSKADLLLYICTEEKHQDPIEELQHGDLHNMKQLGMVFRAIHNKIVPIIIDGKWENVVPLWLQGHPYYDLRGSEKITERIGQLVAVLQGETPLEDSIRSTGTITYQIPKRNSRVIGLESEIDSLDNLFKGNDSDSKIPSMVSIVGNAGTGKTELALEYAYCNYRKYRAIFWISGSENKLHDRLKGLLFEILGVSTIKDWNGHDLQLIKYFFEQLGNILFVFDDIQESDQFILEDLLGQSNANSSTTDEYTVINNIFAFILLLRQTSGLHVLLTGRKKFNIAGLSTLVMRNRFEWGEGLLTSVEGDAGTWTKTHLSHYKGWTILVAFDNVDRDWGAQGKTGIYFTISSYINATASSDNSQFVLNNYFSSKEDALHAAMLETDKLIKMSLDDLLAHAESLIDTRHLEEAFAIYQNILKEHPQYELAQIGQADILREMGRYDEALATYEKVFAISPGNIRAKIGQAEAFRAIGRYDSTLTIYRELCIFYPENLEVNTGLADVLRTMGRYAEALAIYDEVCVRFPENVVARIGRADVLRTMERYAEALATYDEVCVRFPENVVARIGRADVLRTMERYAEALATYDETSALFPENVVAKIGRAEVLRAMARYAEALATYDEICARFPENVVAMTGRADVLQAMGHYAEALATYDETCARFPENVVAMTGRADVLRAMGRYEEAIAVYRETCAAFPNNLEARNSLAELLRMVGQYSETIHANNVINAHKGKPNKGKSTVAELMEKYSIGNTELAKAADVSIGAIKSAREGRQISRKTTQRKLLNGLNMILASMGERPITIQDIFADIELENSLQHNIDSGENPNLRSISSNTTNTTRQESGIISNTQYNAHSLSVDILVVTVHHSEFVAAQIAFDIENVSKDTVSSGSIMSCKTNIKSNLMNRQLNVVIIMVGEYGSDSCMGALARYLNDFEPKLLMLVGIATAEYNKAKLGDVVVAQHVLEYNDTQRHNSIPSISQYDSSITADVERFHPSISKWHEKIDKCRNILQVKQLFSMPQIASNNYRPTIHNSLILSGGKITTNNISKISRIDIDDRIRAIDMESYGLVDICQVKQIPWLIFKGIVNIGGTAIEKHWEYTSALAAATAAKLFIEDSYHPPKKAYK